eukprot:m.31951 g.31951  ORF g.31951 m.31951 type:complete len:83 (-) comp12381_c0_seq1:2402-2650(-)
MQILLILGCPSDMIAQASSQPTATWHTEEDQARSLWIHRMPISIDDASEKRDVVLCHLVLPQVCWVLPADCRVDKWVRCELK